MLTVASVSLQVVSVDIPPDRLNPILHRTFAYVEFESPEAVKEAIEGMNNSVVDGKPITVTQMDENLAGNGRRGSPPPFRGGGGYRRRSPARRRSRSPARGGGGGGGGGGGKRSRSRTPRRRSPIRDRRRHRRGRSASSSD